MFLFWIGLWRVKSGHDFGGSRYSRAVMLEELKALLRVGFWGSKGPLFFG